MYDDRPRSHREPIAVAGELVRHGGDLTNEAAHVIRDQTKEIERLGAELTRLEERIFQVHPRVWKLVDKCCDFLVIGEHEPYYLPAYAMIREQEMQQGTWTEDDRIAYAAAQLSSAEAAGGE